MVRSPDQRRWSLIDEIHFLDDTKALRGKNATWAQDKKPAVSWEIFATRYLESLANRTLGWERQAHMSDTDKDELSEYVRKL